MSKIIIPDAALQQHIAVLGKTGAGKTATAKLAIEQIVDAGGRVCIMDPLKSDWWGLTSSSDGKRPGLPFDILGGPRGHVPLHAGAGKAIAEIVGTGALPLSILDMADFGAGGQMQFFVDFAPMLLKKMRGVLHLVIEEAHLFAPKERAGFGSENMAIHWAKTLATAGRSKGVRMIVLTQRTQALHNALLGSCDSVIVHRFTAPADQEPVIKWLKANVTDKEIRDRIVNGMSSLKTGEGWLCSGEAKIFELRHFPRIRTFDNSATPTNDAAEVDVKTAPIDQDKLRALIGTAVKEAESNDPKLLRAEIAKLKTDIAKAGSLGAYTNEIKKALDDSQLRGREDGYAQARAENAQKVQKMLAGTNQLRIAAEKFGEQVVQLEMEIEQLRANYFQIIPVPLKQKVHIEASQDGKSPEQYIVAHGPKYVAPGSAALSKAERLILTALAQYPDGRTKKQVAILTGYAVNGGGFGNAIGALRSKGYLEGTADQLTITDSGIAALGTFTPLPRGDALLQHWYRQLGKAERKCLEVLASEYPVSIGKEELAERAGYEVRGGGFGNALGRLRTLELIHGYPLLSASGDLFE
jgi:hypothetical protein